MTALQEAARTALVVLSPIWLACLAGAIGWTVKWIVRWRRMWREAWKEANS